MNIKYIKSGKKKFKKKNIANRDTKFIKNSKFMQLRM